MTLLNSKPAAAIDAPPRARTRQPIRWRAQIAAYLFLLPALALFAIFAWYPILNSVIMSFQDVSLNAESTWIGFRNYERMFADPVFVSSWRNSFEFAVLSILIGFFIPVLVGILVNEMKLAKGFFRVVYFLPSVIPALIAILVWKLIYAPSGGLLNSFITALGGTGQNWLFNPALVKPSILIIMTWGGFGGTMLIYLASLQDLPVELYEAAEIDGATPWQRIRHITLPFLRPTMIVLLIVQVLGIVQIFLEPFVLTEGGPGQATTTPVLTLYRKAFLNGEYGLASAWSVLLMVVLGVISILYLRATRSQSN
jgi:multiple sugar transport system permease protein